MTDTHDTTPPSDRPDGVESIAIEEEMRRSYLDYAMSVIVSRAIPDARDGLKPVHRRILWSMHENGQTFDKSYNKSAKTVGDVMGSYHPHGDSAIYDALVRLAQPWSMRLKLIDGQGNFGSIDNDPAAAMRYTEARMAEAANYLLADIDKDTVDFQPNYDGKDREPTVLPSRFPNMLVNGAGGIAVGMATNIPPHNLGEVCDAALTLLDRDDVTDEELLELVPGPDFPTGGYILGRSGARKGLMTGRGSVVMRARTDFEEIGQRTAIIVSEVPYQVNKASLVEKIAELVRDKRVEGIADMRDESDRDGIRVVIELKRDATPEVVLNQLYRFTPMQTSFGVNMLALDSGRPRVMPLRDMLDVFIRFRKEVVARRAKFELSKARDRAHVLVGLAMAVANIDEVIELIRNAPDPSAAREGLLSRTWPARDMEPLVKLIADPRSIVNEDGEIRLTLEQVKAILDLRLQRLTGLGRDEINDEAKGLMGKIQDLLDILRSKARVIEIIRDELTEVKEKFAEPRKTQFLEGDLDVEDEDLIAREDMVVTITEGGYVKRTPLSIYRTQARGGKGRAGMAMKEEDVVTGMFVASTHDPVLFFTASGLVFKEKVWRLPQGAPNSRGKYIGNVLGGMDQDDSISSVMAMPEDEDSWGELDVVFATRSGKIRRNKLSDFVQVNRNGKIAMKPDEGDGIVGVKVCKPEDDILLTTAFGRCIRFRVEDVRVFAGRTSTGVRGIKMDDARDYVISLAILRHMDVTPEESRAYLRHANAMRRAAGEETDDADLEEGEEALLSQERIAELGAAEEFILTVADRGYGKRSSAYEYRVTGRGGKGLLAHRLRGKDWLNASFPVEASDDVMLMTDGGQMIRTPADTVRIAGRATQGVIIVRLKKDEKVISVRRIAESDSDEAADAADGNDGEGGESPPSGEGES